MSRKHSTRLMCAVLAMLFSVLACSYLAPAAEQAPTQPPTVALPTAVPEPSKTNTQVPTSTSEPTATPLPTATPEPISFPASAESIEIGGYRFHIVRIAYDNTLMGLQPSNMGSNEQIMCIELELTGGDKSAFQALEVVTVNASGVSAVPVALMAEGRTNLLTAMTMTGEASTYEPDAKCISWAFVVPKTASTLYLVFPTGEQVDLSSPPQPAPPSTAASTATSPPPTATPTQATTPLPTWTIAPQTGEEKIRVENNSGQDFYIKMDCSGGPCLAYNNAHYEYKFPAGLYFFYVYPGRYKITWTICGKTETFEHVLNGQWYILLKKCK